VTPEAKVKAKIKEVLKMERVYYAMPIGTGWGNSGVPDFLCCVNGRFLGIEAKANGNKPTELQKKNLMDIELSGGYTAVINENASDLQYLVELIKQLKELRYG
jgi:pantoate kinase